MRALTLFLACLAGAASAEEPQPIYLVPGPVTVRLMPGVALPDQPGTRDAWRTFQARQTPIGAFAVAPSGAFGWAEGRLSIGNATRSAMAFCLQHDPDCRIYGILAPEALTEEEALVVNASVQGALDRMATIDARIGLAVSPDGAWGLGWHDTNLPRAQDRAIAECRAQVTSAASPDTLCRLVTPVAGLPRPPVADEDDSTAGTRDVGNFDPTGN